MDTAAATPDAQTRMDGPHHHVFARIGGSVTDTVLIAAVEGSARLIAAALTHADNPDRGIEEGLAALAARTGFPLGTTVNTVDGVILDTYPLSLLLIGERRESDADALSSVRALGVVRYFSIPSVPPRHAEREPEWAEKAIAAWRLGKVAAALVDVPDGSLPVWVAQLFNAVAAAADPLPLIVLASDATIAEIAPPSARIALRGDQLPAHLASALAAVQCARLLSVCPEPPSVFRRQALVTATIAAQRTLGGTVLYLDIAEGTTLIEADGAHATVTHEARYDCGAGAPAVLAHAPATTFTPWLPVGTDIVAARHWALQRAAWPAAILTEPADREIAGALARALIAQIGDTQALAMASTIVLGPGWCRWAIPSEMLAIVGDMIAPAHPVQVVLDPDDVFAITGMLARTHPESAETVFIHDALHPIGTVLAAPKGTQRDATPLRVSLTSGGRTTEWEVPSETVMRLPVHEASILTVAGHQAAATPRTILPSECGLIVDTRRRPLTSASAPTTRTSVSDRLRTRV